MHYDHCPSSRHILTWLKATGRLLCIQSASKNAINFVYHRLNSSLLRSSRGFIFVILFYIICIICLILLFWYGYLESTSISGWFTVRILPAVVGTVTNALFKATFTGLSRLTPYAKCAGNWVHGRDQRQEQKETVRNSLMGYYFPFLSFRDQLRSGDALLNFGWVVFILCGNVLPLKSSFLNTSDYFDSVWETWVAREYLYPLLSIYFLLVLFSLALLIRTWNWTTGLRWDPVSIADQMALFYHSDCLGDFKGLDAVDADEAARLSSEPVYRLGYWRIIGAEPGEYWHGFARDRKFFQRDTFSWLWTNFMIIQPLARKYPEGRMYPQTKHQVCSTKAIQTTSNAKLKQPLIS